jgi:hypothetical protein
MMKFTICLICLLESDILSYAAKDNQGQRGKQQLLTEEEMLAVQHDKRSREGCQKAMRSPDLYLFVCVP